MGPDFIILTNLAVQIVSRNIEFTSKQALLFFTAALLIYVITFYQSTVQPKMSQKLPSAMSTVLGITLSEGCGGGIALCVAAGCSPVVLRTGLFGLVQAIGCDGAPPLLLGCL